MFRFLAVGVKPHSVSPEKPSHPILRDRPWKSTLEMVS